MSDTKIFSFPDGGSCSNGNLLGILAPMLQQRGLDPNLLLAMNNGNNGFGGEGGWFIWVIFLFFLMGWGGNGMWGNNGGNGRNGFNAGNADLAGLITSENGKDLLMSAIQGNANAISQLASTISCDINSVQNGLNALQTQLCNVGNSVGMTGQSVINAIQQGNCQLGNQLATCCCSIQDAITRQGYENQLATVNQTNALQNSINTVNSSVERGFASTNYETFKQTCDIQNAIESNTNKILEGQRAAEMREMQNKLDSLREKNQTLEFAASQAAQTQAIIAQLQPVAKPCYITCSPYQSQVLPYMGYNPYGTLTYNGGNCGCNCGCGV